MTKTDKKLTENDQILDPKIEKNAIFLVLFELKKYLKKEISINWFDKYINTSLVLSITFSILGITISLIIASILWGLIQIGS